MMKVLVVTGGIGSGKSSVCRILHDKYGLPVYDADSQAKRLYVDVPSLLADMENSLGMSLRDESGDFNPAELSKIIFKDPMALRKVEDLLFPVLLDDFNSWKNRCSTDWVVFESATILEKPYFSGFGDVVMLVDAPMSLRKERAMARDKASGEKVSARMNQQPLMNSLSEGVIDRRIDHIVRNDSSLSELESEVGEFWRQYSV